MLCKMGFAVLLGELQSLTGVGGALGWTPSGQVPWVPPQAPDLPEA